MRLVQKGLMKAASLHNEGMLMEAEYDKVKEVMQDAKARIRKRYVRTLSEKLTGKAIGHVHSFRTGTKSSHHLRLTTSGKRRSQDAAFNTGF